MNKFIKSILFIFAIIIIISYTDFNNKKKLLTTSVPINKILFAHRGLPKFAENSWESFKQSQSLGLNSIECDVQFTKDTKLIIFHDKNAERLLGIDQNIKDLIWTDIESKAIIHNNEITEQYVLSLDELLDYRQIFHYLYLDFQDN